ncbi:DNA replication and repair protein RecF [Wandonia haliotis]|uniref:DNA replication and repair protein RecF n=1 Tax=Wandonia haliotis TaxID=574963 RepID=A0ABP3Y468_9FLAO
MEIRKLHIVQFKNYQEAEISFFEGVNCFIGPNGSGKTNILDAIHYLSMCRSYLNPIDSQNIRFEQSFFMLQSVWNKDGQEVDLYCGVKKGQKKIFKKNKAEYDKLAEHIGSFPAVMISPYDRNLISEGSEVRRKWMDGIISQFDRRYLENLMRYNRILDQRNALLKNQLKNGFFDRESFEVWDEQLLETGHSISTKRQEFLKEFIPIFQLFYDELGASGESVNLIYKSQLIEGDFRSLLVVNMDRDKHLGYTSVGIHKDDLIFELNAYPIKKFGSQGQQKSYLIALRLAQYEWLKKHLNQNPLLLLDDIFDKLDNNRVEKLMQMVSNHSFGQVLVTDTDEERVKRIFDSIQEPFRMFKVESGKIEQIELQEAR